MKWFWILLSLLLALAVGVAVEIHKLSSQISYDLDFGSLIDALALLFVGAVLEYAYLKRSSERQADTDLLLGILAEAKTALGMLVEKSQPCEAGRALTQSQQVSLTCAARELSNAVHSIEEALRHCQVDLHKLQFEKLKDARAALNESLTDSPYPGPYDPTSRVRIRSAFKTMRDELIRVAFAINRR